MIWVVTNHHDTRHTVIRLLAAKGYKATEFDCGDAVVPQLRFQTPKVIIIDCGVPDSFDTLQKIRASSRAQPIPIIMFSIDDQDLKEKSLLSGADAYVPKGSLDWIELLTEVVRFAGPPSNENP